MRISGQKATIVIALAAFLAGLLLGWLVIGWWLWPVEYYDTDPVDLRAEHKLAYVTMVADSYFVTHDLDQARQRLAGWPPDELAAILTNLQSEYMRQGRGSDAQRIAALARDLGITPSAQPTAPGAETAPAPRKGILANLVAICGVLIGIAILLAAAALGWSYLQKRRGVQVVQPAAGPAPAPTAVPGAPAPPAPAAPPLSTLGTFASTYNLGDDSFDESFAIETPSGEFLGECGMGISETLGEGTPSLVTAFEVWLFDKSDIRTVTKVLMSQYAFEDAELRTRLAPKGEAILAEPGKIFTLETSTLRVRAEIKEMAYGAGEGPEQSHFARLSVQLTAMPKRPEE